MSAKWCSVGQYDQTNAVRSATSQSDCLDFHPAADGVGPAVLIGARVRVGVLNNAVKPHVFPSKVQQIEAIGVPRY